MDTLTWVIVVFVFCIMGILAVKVVNDLGPDIRSEIVESAADNRSVEVYDDVTTRLPSVLDAGVVLAFVLLWAVVIIASFMIDSNPLFFVISIVLMIAVLFVGATLQMFYEELILDSAFATVATDLPMTDWILSHIFIITLMVLGSVLIALYGKNAIQN